MNRTAKLGLALGLALAGPARAVETVPASAETAPHATPVDRPVRIAVTSPRPGTVVRGRFDMAELAGVAESGKRATLFDVVLVIDVSGSTKWPSGMDIDGDGTIGEMSYPLGKSDSEENSDPDDSILAAEIKAAHTLLDSLDPRRVRVGIVSFSGEIDPATMRRRSVNQQDALVEQALTTDFAVARQSLDRVLLRGPHGGTNMAAGIHLGLVELAAIEGALSSPRPEAKKVILLLTDGKPSLPFGLGNQEDPEDIEAVVEKARLASTAGILINCYGLGVNAIDYPVAATEMARVTGGLYTPVRRPGDIVTLLSGVSFANIEDVVAVNLTLGEMAGPEDILVHPDGSFQGFVPVRPGHNRIRLSALASDGSRTSTEFDLEFRHQDLTDLELEAELERVRKRRRELELVMEREKQQAFRREERKRALEIEAEEERDEKPKP